MLSVILTPIQIMKLTLQGTRQQQKHTRKNT
jgi:hypothetical protein